MTPLEQWIRWLQGEAMPEPNTMHIDRLSKLTDVTIKKLNPHAAKFSAGWKKDFRRIMSTLEQALEDCNTFEDFDPYEYFDEEGDIEFWERD